MNTIKIAYKLLALKMMCRGMRKNICWDKMLVKLKQWNRTFYIPRFNIIPRILPYFTLTCPYSVHFYRGARTSCNLISVSIRSLLTILSFRNNSFVTCCTFNSLAFRCHCQSCCTNKFTNVSQFFPLFFLFYFQNGTFDFKEYRVSRLKGQRDLTHASQISCILRIILVYSLWISNEWWKSAVDEILAIHANSIAPTNTFQNALRYSHANVTCLTQIIRKQLIAYTGWFA